MKNKLFTDVMLDVESLGNEGQFIVTSIACIPFNPITGETGEPRQWTISIANSIKYGFSANPETVEWWTKQSPIEFQGMFKNHKSISTSIKEMKDYFRHYCFERCWATGTLDYQAISNLSAVCDRKNPIHYSIRLCARTIRHIYNAKYPPIVIENTHNAVDDCKKQIEVLVRQLETLGIDFSNISNS